MGSWVSELVSLCSCSCRVRVLLSMLGLWVGGVAKDWVSIIPDRDRGICLGNFILIFFRRLALRFSCSGISWARGSSGLVVGRSW